MREHTDQSIICKIWHKGNIKIKLRPGTWIIYYHITFGMKIYPWRISHLLLFGRNQISFFFFSLQTWRIEWIITQDGRRKELIKGNFGVYDTTLKNGLAFIKHVRQR